jgi:hypothetical protein
MDQICGIIKSEEALIDQFALEILCNMIASLSLCHVDDPALGM